MGGIRWQPLQRSLDLPMEPHPMTELASQPLVRPTGNRWDSAHAATLSPLAALAYRSNLLGADRAVANFGGGNTSSKIRQPDHTGREIEVLWVKGSGSDLATIEPGGFTGLKLDEITPLFDRHTMTDEAMVAYLGRCQLEPGMPRASIETLLHAFVPFPHVDHTHPDAVNAICCAENGEMLARECFGDEAVWIPYIRPGFALSRQVGQAVQDHPKTKMILLAKHGLVTWGETHEGSYAATVEAINRAAAFANARAGDKVAFGGAARVSLDGQARDDLLAAVLPVLRGAVSAETSKVLRVDTSDAVMAFVCGADSAPLSQVGAACPDHLVHTKMRPLWVDFDPATEGTADLGAKLRAGVADYRARYEAYYAAHQNPAEPAPMADPFPRVVLIAGVGLVAIGRSVTTAELARDLYHRSIAVIRGASSLDRFVSLTEAESFAIEYWPLELYKLSLAPAPKELAGKVALVTGGAGGIGGAVARSLAAEGAAVVVADLNPAGAGEVAATLGGPGLPVTMDVTAEAAVVAGFHQAVLAYGGVDVVISNAALASSAPIEETTVELWDRNHAVLTRGYFLVSREAFRVWRAQGIGGSLVYVVSKNAVYAGKAAAAYSSAKAAELHLARCLAEEGGALGIRVNVVNPDAVLRGSGIWGSAWREERARAYGIAPDELDAFYRKRTTLGVSVYPEDIAEAVLFFASGRSAKTTGNMLNVDGGVAAAYPR